MGRRGPPKKPTALMELTGSWRLKTRQGEVEPPNGTPEAPGWLSPRALEYWHHILPVLQEMRLLTEADADALALYVQSLARLSECEELITKHGLTYEQRDEAGQLKMVRARPEQKMAKELYTIVSRLGQQFGLTPSSRAHLNVGKKPDKPVGIKGEFFGEKVSNG